MDLMPEAKIIVHREGEAVEETAEAKAEAPAEAPAEVPTEAVEAPEA